MAVQRQLVVWLLATAAFAGCRGQPDWTHRLRLATTTSTYDSGLLEAILPDFERRYGVQVDVIAVGTGQALALGAAGDVDAVLVHAPEQEAAFAAAGHGAARREVMVNDFVLVGPPADPARVRNLPAAADALRAVAAARAPFASRGDESGTHAKERQLWAAAGLRPEPGEGWYDSVGQGMGAALVFANERGAYTLTDRATFLARRAVLPNLEILVGGAAIAENPDPALLNPYGVIAVSPAKPRVNGPLAAQFVEWLTSAETRQRIAEFGREAYGQPLFHLRADAEGSR